MEIRMVKEFFLIKISKLFLKEYLKRDSLLKIDKIK